VQQDLIDRLQHTPGVEAAASAAIVPISGSGWNETLVIDGVSQKTHSNINQVGQDYFRLMTIPLIMGRGFSETDTLAAPRVAIVSRAMAGTFFPGRSAVGRSFHFRHELGEPDHSYEIVGIVADTTYGDLRDTPGPIIFLPKTQQEEPGNSVTVLVRSASVTPSLTAAITQAARETNPAVLVSFTTLEEGVRASLLRERLMATLSGFFGGLAAVLAAVGLYGVMAYGVARRRHEIGMRMALGADRVAILSLILREAAMLVGIGLVIGTGLAVMAARSAATLLFDLKPSDPATLAIAAAGLAVVAACASAWPALGAVRLSPTAALKED
jgi:predicted permease